MSQSSSILSASNVSKSFPTSSGPLEVLKKVSFEIGQGESMSIIGPSGSGKTTLLGLCAGLEKPSEGKIFLAGKDLTLLNEEELAKLRRESVGFVFQNFQLISTLSAVENVLVPLELQGVSDAESRAVEMLERVGLGDRLRHYPVQLSGGEQQRVALARAFAKEPLVLFADEPTGNLDGGTGEQIEQLLFDLNRDSGTTLVIVTHDLSLAEKTQKRITLDKGEVVLSGIEV